MEDEAIECGCVAVRGGNVLERRDVGVREGGALGRRPPSPRLRAHDEEPRSHQLDRRILSESDVVMLRSPR